jgi:hypothetical protein
MNETFKELIGKCVLVYLDDILIFSKTPEEHAVHLEQVLELLRKHHFYAKLSKCEFNKSEVHFLGHVVSAEGIKVDDRKIAAVAEWPVPTDVGKLRSFLGLANYFRKFVQGYSQLVSPLTRLLRNDVAYEWSEECQSAFDCVKHALTHAPVLAAPDWDAPFEVVCDACGYGIGAVLMQHGRPIAYESRRLTPAEFNYTTGEQELLAVVHALVTWRCYLESGGNEKFTVVTDHNPNTFLDTQKNLSRRQARWSAFLQRYNFKWEYRPGRTNVADPLSRESAAVSLSMIRLGVLTRARAAKEGADALTDFQKQVP